MLRFGDHEPLLRLVRLKMFGFACGLTEPTTPTPSNIYHGLPCYMPAPF
jgi:hypothetical protein